MGRKKKIEITPDDYFINIATDIADNYHERKQHLEKLRESIDKFHEYSIEEYIHFKFLRGVSYGDKVQISGVSDLVGDLSITCQEDLDRFNKKLRLDLSWEFNELDSRLKAFDEGMDMLEGRVAVVARQLFIEQKSWKTIVDEKGRHLHREQIRRAKAEAINRIAVCLQIDSDKRLISMLV